MPPFSVWEKRGGRAGWLAGWHGSGSGSRWVEERGWEGGRKEAKTEPERRRRNTQGRSCGGNPRGRRDAEAGGYGSDTLRGTYRQR